MVARKKPIWIRVKMGNGRYYGGKVDSVECWKTVDLELTNQQSRHYVKEGNSSSSR